MSRSGGAGRGRPGAGRERPGAGLADLGWLLLTQLRNRALWMLRRIRDPKYLIALLAGVAYFVVLFIPMFLDDSGADAANRVAETVGAAGEGAADDADAGLQSVIAMLAPFGIAVWLLVWWFRGGYQDALAFAPAETHMLFPAPFERRTLLRYKLLKAHMGVLFTVLFLGVFLLDGGAAWYITFGGLWITITTLHLHQIGSSLVRVMATKGGRAGRRRVVFPLVIAGAALVAIGYSVAAAVSAARQEAGFDAALEAIRASLAEPVPAVALWPFQALVAPALATDFGGWLAALPAALLILVLHYVWVMRTSASFEEAAAEAGERRAQIVAAVKSGRSPWAVGGKSKRKPGQRWIRPPLADRGEPAMALMWKHALAFTGDLRPTTLLIVIGGIASVFGLVVWASGSLETAATTVAVLTAMFAGMVLFLGPMAARYDLRRDLQQVTLLRTYPLDPRWVVGVEVATASALLTLVTYVLLLLTLVSLPATEIPRQWLGVAVGATLLFGLAAPGLLALGVVVQNALTLLFPGWVRLGATGGQGIDAFGQGLLTMLVTSVLLLMLVVPLLLAAALFTLAFLPSLHEWAWIPGAIGAMGVLWAEVILAVRWLGGLYERLDPAEAGLLR